MELSIDQKLKILEQQSDNEIKNIILASELKIDKTYIKRALDRHRETQEKYKHLFRYKQKSKTFYIDNLLFTNGSESANNYQIIIEHLKDMFFDGYTPYGLCMGIVGKQEIHHYKAIDRLRGYEFIHGNKPSHGICSECLDYHNKEIENEQNKTK